MSKLVVTASVTRARLGSEIASRIPPVLAEEKDRPIGAPGRVTYVVRRGSVNPELYDGKLRVNTTAQADISVCKPLGPFCVGYGSCQPVFVSTVDLPLSLTDDYAWQRPSAGITVARGCRIAGFDATPRLRSLAESNLGALQSQVASSLPPLKPGLEQAWRLLAMPIYLDKDWCLKLTPRGLTQGPARQVEQQLRLSAALDAEVVVKNGCDASQEAPELPPLASAASLPESGTLYVSQTLTSTGVEHQLAEALVGDLQDSEKISGVEVRGARFEGNDVLLVGLTLDARTCGTAWFRTTPKAVDADHVKLSEITPLRSEPAATMKLLGERIASAGVLKPEFPFAALGRELENLVAGLSQGLDEGVAFRLTLGPPGPLPPDVTPAGLELWSSLSVDATGKLE